MGSMQTSSLQQLIATFNEAFESLEVKISMPELESLAITIHKAMTVSTRTFHQLEHVFGLLAPQNPIQNLAALFHDLVYYQVDQGFSPEAWESIAPYIIEDADELCIVSKVPPDDWHFSMLLEIFDFECGQQLTPANGSNEFLSALVMMRQLGNLLTPQDLFRVAALIEATIPFRGRCSAEDNHFDILERRLNAVNERYLLGMGQEQIIQSVQAAAIFANKDVESFAEPDVAKFLDNTWKLLPEMNRALRDYEVYSIRSYRQALQNREAFLDWLTADQVFNCYRGAPPQEALDEMLTIGQHNIDTARQYLRLKLLTGAILEALAEVSGGDAPMSLFMGDVPKFSQRSLRLEDYLPELDNPPWVDSNSSIYRVLKYGRAGNATFDVNTSLVTLFIYQSLPDEECDRLLVLSDEMFQDQLSAEDFLRQVKPEVVASIARASAAMIYTRRDKLLGFIEETI
jgi:hypothetical protein